MKDTVRIAAVQTYTEVGAGCDDKNIEYAYRAMDEASANGADIICFPETFPGALRAPIDFDPGEAMSKKAGQIGKYVVYGAVIDAPGEPGKHHVRNILLGPDGKEIGHYDRTCPGGLGPWLYKGGRYWDFDYTPGGALPVFQTELGTIGLLVCSEVYVPELSRALAVQGAEIVFLPAGLSRRALRKTWRLLIRARAVENLMYTVTCNNICALPGCDDPRDALAMIVSPEDDVAESSGECILYADADMKRLRWLRDTEDSWNNAALDPAYRVKPGLLRHWRTPELWRKLI